MELREAIQAAIADEINAMPTTASAKTMLWLVRSRRLKMADRILAIPEIAEALGQSFCGIPIVEDASVPPGEIHIKS